MDKNILDYINSMFNILYWAIGIYAGVLAVLIIYLFTTISKTKEYVRNEIKIAIKEYKESIDKIIDLIFSRIKDIESGDRKYENDLTEIKKDIELVKIICEKNHPEWNRAERRKNT